ncbi:RNA 2',3'-cyclic phosphodiesterase [Amycolatopsis regifaucium]|uniref:RNA 2',3'-cyclic phosphodiesterase n=1 Tax=Amycolatopsis regifaucium TaxID=546365 RepID=A0A154MK46_9PSEU|nr:RNA 2',3'-cyclic phosphodiesterase [Amycolatopsis regifaucium]KZB84676.1 2'-5' RNA ligase [Amycolatopsis regifaucium]OKA11141.1 2'-5' RNA ligase [Amycolatopsis regifaucium]SFI29895.1 2'-5' RNA ligase [Amycolatopsis regifaucium]
MNLFSALIPPDDVLDEIATALGSPEDGDFRWSRREHWHVTLGFYGEDDAGERAAWLAGRLAEATAFGLRLEKAATFPGVLWLSVTGTGLHELAVKAGAGDEGRPYTAHLTVARFPRDRPMAASAWVKRLAGFTSRTWTATEAVLMRSDREQGASHYRVIRSYELKRARA